MLTQVKVTKSSLTLLYPYPSRVHQVGQLVSWSNLVNVHAFTCSCETLDFGGAHVGEAFIRQGQIRYTTCGFSFALENPYTFGMTVMNLSNQCLISLLVTT